MKLFLPQFYIFLLLNFGNSNASIWIKNVQLYGSATIAIGTKCLSTISKYYFEDESTLTRSKILVVSFTRNLSTPANDIQKSYLLWVHEAILNGEMNKYVILFICFIQNKKKCEFFLFVSLKVELVSNAAPIKDVSHDESNTIYEKDYYVFVIDDINKVYFLFCKQSIELKLILLFSHSIFQSLII